MIQVAGEEGNQAAGVEKSAARADIHFDEAEILLLNAAVGALRDDALEKSRRAIQPDGACAAIGEFFEVA